jgi:methionine-S-sulfoxide reductase
MTKTLILAGGCFWCVEHDLRHAPDVQEVVSGYSGGESTDPTYERHNGHREVVLVTYDETQTSYKKILQFFLDHIDPTDGGGQFGDRGESYRSAIYYENDEELKNAQEVLLELDESKIYTTPHKVELLERKPFYQAEEYHQKYSEKNPFHYSLYRKGSGREDFVNRTCQIRDEKHIPWKE